jgi:hypothetical protein
VGPAVRARELRNRNHKESIMVKRLLPFVVLALAVALFVASPALAEEKAEKNAESHIGTVVSFDGKTLVMKDKDDKEHKHNIGDKTILMLDNKKSDVATFKTLKEGTKVRVWCDKDDKEKVTKIEALDKETDFPKK